MSDLVRVRSYSLIRTNGRVTVYISNDDVCYCAIDEHNRFNISLAADLCGVHLFRLFDRKERSRFRQVRRQEFSFLNGLYASPTVVDAILEHALTDQIKELARGFFHYCFEFHNK